MTKLKKKILILSDPEKHVATLATRYNTTRAYVHRVLKKANLEATTICNPIIPTHEELNKLPLQTVLIKYHWPTSDSLFKAFCLPVKAKTWTFVQKQTENPSAFFFALKRAGLKYNHFPHKLTDLASSKTARFKPTPEFYADPLTWIKNNLEYLKRAFSA